MLISLTKQHLVVTGFIFREDVDHFWVQELPLEISDSLSLSIGWQIHDLLDVFVNFTVLPIHVDDLDFWLLLLFHWFWRRYPWWWSWCPWRGWIFLFNYLNGWFGLVLGFWFVKFVPTALLGAADRSNSVCHQRLWRLFFDAYVPSWLRLVQHLRWFNLCLYMSNYRWGLWWCSWCLRSRAQSHIPSLRLGSILLNDFHVLTHFPGWKSNIIKVNLVLYSNVLPGSPFTHGRQSSAFSLDLLR